MCLIDAGERRKHLSTSRRVECCMSARRINFGAGPSALPLQVLQELQKDIMDLHGSGVGICEVSHRSATFANVFSQARRNLVELLSIPDDFAILFMQGGATTQFSAIPLNLSRHFGKAKANAVYLVTGGWSAKAAAEAKKYCHATVVKPENSESSALVFPSVESVQDADFVHYCANETVHGVEYPNVPVDHPCLVADMSSNICSQEIDWDKHAVVYAGAQKNMGVAGVTLVVIKKSLLSQKVKVEVQESVGEANEVNEVSFPLPLMMDYKVLEKADSMYNTPPTFALHAAGLVFEWILQQGGVARMRELSLQKSGMLYECEWAKKGLIRFPVQKGERSRMNVVMRLENEEMEKEFLAHAAKEGLVGLKGHRSVGGLRASLYNTLTVGDVERLLAVLDEFFKSHKG